MGDGSICSSAVPAPQRQSILLYPIPPPGLFSFAKFLCGCWWRRTRHKNPQGQRLSVRITPLSESPRCCSNSVFVEGYTLCSWFRVQPSTNERTHVPQPLSTSSTSIQSTTTTTVVLCHYVARYTGCTTDTTSCDIYKRREIRNRHIGTHTTSRHASSLWSRWCCGISVDRCFRYVFCFWLQYSLMSA